MFHICFRRMESSETTEQTNDTLSDSSEMMASLEDINPKKVFSQNENISKGWGNAILHKQGL